MAQTRIKDLTTASAMADDDYIAIDGVTNGTRKILASDVGHVYSVTTASTTSSIDARGVNNSSTIMLYPTSASDVTVENATKIKVYARQDNSSYTSIYPLEITTMTVGNSNAYFYFTVKSHSGNPQSTTASYLQNVYVTAMAPFELASISFGK